MSQSPQVYRQDQALRTSNAPVTPLRYVFLLLDQFSYLTFSGAIEALRLANGYGQKSYYQWDVLSETGAPVTGSNGLTLQVTGSLRPVGRCETLIVCGGDNITETATPGIVSWLRRNARKGARYGGMSTGGFVLAKAGMLTGAKATLHWEYHDAFREMFPQIELLDTIYFLEGKRFTCAGCAASMDMMLRLIADDYGQELARYVSDLMVYTSPRSCGHGQRMSVQARCGIRHPKLTHSLELMSEQLEDPLSTPCIAKAVGLSTRQLERLFRKYLNTTPGSYYTSLRLERARALLLQTEMSVTEVGLATGFKSRTHFTRRYRQQFGIAPTYENGLPPG
ncbi:GlxA family transcriptional regulator [Leisingera daeponensis]|uniref:GlxA family transcriptional regulator n=1 Tax=Leisingera daeponensis TaxID=405746 RepID=UPI001C974CFA|nr:GlxA family transcriptional regulator [Leisingera daeponensis]MBY6058762.1 GlxA family transcriptional regulator [Leisingera daeponensis]